MARVWRTLYYFSSSFQSKEVPLMSQPTAPNIFPTQHCLPCKWWKSNIITYYASAPKWSRLIVSLVCALCIFDLSIAWEVKVVHTSNNLTDFFDLRMQICARRPPGSWPREWRQLRELSAPLKIAFSAFFLRANVSSISFPDWNMCLVGCNKILLL